ncbi:hypothetical protein [Pantoea stewartii]|uniref:hypothetical protein n=1 Tax=Pantoea stewartii TaxID=66269 RepID=UPI0025A1458F|nr:hypothetical protein [Pantoea stewartii]
MEKRQRRILSAFSDLNASLLIPVIREPGNARRSITAGAQRLVKRGGVISPTPAFRTYASHPHFHLPQESTS